MNTCDLCFRETRNQKRNSRGELECTECRDARAYTESLTPAERRADEAAIAQYVTESEKW